ncbi:DUF664 domain-containing protein [Streptomyces monashensis]|uniref:mycothiol transferase n=1 Tax=Streptomyces monashensis TaxID=1678012 RepID=UPI0033F4D2A7
MKLINILVHILTETSRHAGHADMLRELLDGTTGTAAQYATPQGDEAKSHADDQLPGARTLGCCCVTDIRAQAITA